MFRKSLAFLLAFLPAFLPLIYMIGFNVNVHVGDEWDPDIAGIYIKAWHGQLSISNLFALHNEHRLFVPRLLYLLLNHFTHWNNLVDVLAGWVMIVVVSFCVLYFIRRGGVPDSPQRWLWRWFFCNIVIFTAAQVESWLSAWGAANSMPVMFTALAVVAAADGVRTGSCFALCALLAAAASFSNGSGFAAWLAVAIMMTRPVLTDGFRFQRARLAAWFGVAGLCAGLYAIHYHAPPHLDVYQPTIGRFLFYLTAFIANVFMFNDFESTGVCPVIGIVIFTLLLACAGYFFNCLCARRMQICVAMLPWFALASFSVIADLMGASFRSGYSTDQATISRYVTFSFLATVSLVNLVPLVCHDLRLRLPERWSVGCIQVPTFFAAGILFWQIESIPGSLNSAEPFVEHRIKEKAAIAFLKILPRDGALISYLSDTPHLAEEAAQANEMGYLNPPMIASNNAAELLKVNPKPADAVRGNLENIKADGPNGKVSVIGWAILPRDHRVADAVLLTCTDSSNRPIIFAFATLDGTRVDVARALNDAAYAPSGFSASFDVNALVTMNHDLAINAWAYNALRNEAYPIDGTANITPESSPPHSGG